MENKRLKYLIYFNAISMIVLICLIVVTYVYTVFDYIPSNIICRNDLYRLSEIVFQFVLSLGVLLAYIEYKIKHNWEQKKGLELSFDIQKKQDENLILFKTSVTNKSNKDIKITSAYLEFSDHKTGEFQCKFDLSYYYLENIQIGNETLRYVFPLKLFDYKDDDTIWDVRFKVDSSIGLYRVVHSSFKGTFSEVKINH